MSSADDQPPPLHIGAVLRWPAAMAEEWLHLPDTIRQLRLLLREQVRMARNVNEAAEIVIRLGRRLESTDAAVERVAHLEDTVGELRDRMAGLLAVLPGARQARRAMETFFGVEPEVTQDDEPRPLTGEGGEESRLGP